VRVPRSPSVLGWGGRMGLAKLRTVSTPHGCPSGLRDGQCPHAGTPCAPDIPSTRGTHRRGAHGLATQPAPQCPQHRRALLRLRTGVPRHHHGTATDRGIYSSKAQLSLRRRKRPSLKALPESCVPVRLCTTVNAILRSLKPHPSTVFQ